MSINEFKIIPVLSNQRISPYRATTSDYIQVKAQVFEGDKINPSYIPNLPIDLYFNYNGSWELLETGITNRYGYLTLYHSCVNISGISNCLSKFTTEINGTTYTSNITRINFIEGGVVQFGSDQFVMPPEFITFDDEFIVF